jgi:hypothetical protein
MKQINLASRQSTPLNSFSEKEGESAKYSPHYFGHAMFRKESFCKLRKENDGEIIRSAGKFGKLFCNYRRSSGIIFCLVCKIVEKFTFSKTPSNGK